MAKIVKTNEWRCVEFCPNCPFKDNGRAVGLVDGRVDDIKVMLLKGENFVCHKTAYNLDNEMKPTAHQDRKMCYGAYLYLLEKNKPNQLMQVAKRLGCE